MTKEKIKKLYETYCYNKRDGELERWEETINKVDDNFIKKACIEYGDKITDLDTLENRIIDVLPEKEKWEFLGYENLDDMKKQVKAKIDRLDQRRNR